MNDTLCGHSPHERLETELAETKAVLADLLEQRGESWLAQLMGRREELRSSLWHTECLVCGGGDFLHERECRVAELMRIVGGPEETQRQVDASHEAALNLAPVAGPYAVNLPQLGTQSGARARVTALDRMRRAITYSRQPIGDDE